MKTVTNLKMTRMLLLLFCWMVSVVTYAQVITYPQLTSIQGVQYAYTLKARQQGTSTWQTVPLYNVQVTIQSGSTANSTLGSFDCAGATEIQITYSSTVNTAVIRPASLNITPAISGNTITFTIPGPKKFYVDINDSHYNGCIHVMAQPLEVNPPQPSDPNVVYIPTGTYNSNNITLTDGQTLYVQGGAAVGGVTCANNTKVLGRGFIFRAGFDAINVTNVSNVLIDGLLDMNHGWGGNGGDGIRVGGSSNVIIKNTASFSSKKWGDGYNIISSQNVTVDNVFIRTNDDGITFYGGGKSNFTGDCKNITFTNSVLLPDLAQPIHVGVYGDTYNTEIRNVTCTNIDIDDWSRTGGRPVIFFTVGDQVRAANFHFNDIRVNGYMPASFGKSFINMATVYNGSYNYGPGREIDSVYYNNVSYNGSNGTPNSSINGYDAGRLVKNVFFQGLKINGTTITTASAGNFGIGANTQNISFSGSPVATYYHLQNRNTGLYLDGMGQTTNGDACRQFPATTHPNAQWEMIYMGNYVQFRNRSTGMFLDGMGRTANGSDLGQYANTSSANSQWSVQQFDGIYYRIKNRATNLFIDGMGRTYNGAYCGQYANTTNGNAQWNLIPVASGARIAAPESSEELASDEKGGESTEAFVYPNPTPAEILITLPASYSEGEKIADLQDRNGKTAMSDKFTGTTHTLNIGSLPPGMYVLKVKSNKKLIVKKVIKN